MAEKILLADDSQTIQKVIDITLANEPIDIVLSKNSDELFLNIEDSEIKLLLLDFDLSSDVNGYELAKQVKAKCPNLPILMLFGALDEPDQDLLDAAGVAAKIIKPFDSSEFITACKALMTGEKLEQKEMTLPRSAPEENNWMVDMVSSSELSGENEQTASNIELSPEVLKSELDSWKVEVPSKLNNQEVDPFLIMDLPPVIKASEVEELELEGTLEVQSEVTEIAVEEETAIEIEVKEEEIENEIVVEALDIDLDATSEVVIESVEEVEVEAEDTFFPEQNDLEYPDVAKKFDAVKEPLTLDKLAESSEREEKSTSKEVLEEVKFEPVDTFSKAFPEIKEKVFDDDATMEINMAELEGQLKKEDVEELEDIADKTREVVVESLGENISKDDLKPLIEETLKEYFQETVERIAWEVIPDLAENLIKKELSNIANSVKE